MADYVIEIENLVKRYKELVALDHLNLSVKEGEVFGQCHLVKTLPYWLLFRQGYCNAYLCLIFLLKGNLSVFKQHKKTDCHLSEKKVYLILRIRLHDTENLPWT